MVNPINYEAAMIAYRVKWERIMKQGAPRRIELLRRRVILRQQQSASLHFVIAILQDGGGFNEPKHRDMVIKLQKRRAMYAAKARNHLDQLTLQQAYAMLP